MSTERLIWTILLVVGVGWVAFRSAQGNMGRSYTKEVATTATPKSGPNEGKEITGRPDLVEVSPAQDPQAKLDGWRTLGLWVAAFLTLFLFSFLYKDNPFYKIAEAILVGVSAAYWMVVAFWAVIIPNLLGKLWPRLTIDIFLPGLEAEADYYYIIPLLLGVMLLWRLMPKGGWISRWPLAFIMGTTAGLRLIAHLGADCISQASNSIYPLWAKTAGPTGPEFDFWLTLQNWIIVIGVLSGLVYFFFSVDHKGLVGRVARLGIWFLMITFGASFGYTVMGRIALFAARLEFLLDDWLWVIDPKNRRVASEVVAMMSGWF